MKEVQILNGYLTAINHFLSRSTDKCNPIFSSIKRNGARFYWNEECKEAF